MGAVTDLTRVDVLAIGPHPDDIEIGLGGITAKHAALGHLVGLCDLTAGEMGTIGTVEERLAEAEAARVVLGAAWRVNLRLPDRGIGGDPVQVRAVASLIRQTRPLVVAAPYWSDRHPDHVSASQLITEAVFSAGLRRYDADGDPWRPARLCYYFLNEAAPPSFVVDVSDYYAVKQRAIACHATQFGQLSSEAAETRVTPTRFRQLIESRDLQFGAQIGVAYAEGLVVRHPVVVPHLMDGLTR